MKLGYLRGEREVLEKRLAARKGHFFDPGLLDSQLETLEEPSDVLVVDIDANLEAVIKEVDTAVRPASI